MLYDDFKPIVDLIFNNWTALQLAVEHGMGAPGGEKTAQLMSVYITQYCIENAIDTDNLTEVLEDLMDEEFETVCDDNSPKEIATLLLEYLVLLREGRLQELKERIEAMPKCQKWLSQPVHKSVPPQCHGNPDDDTTSSSDDEDITENHGTIGTVSTENIVMNGTVPSQNIAANGTDSSQNQEPEPMDEDVDPGWTVVKTRRKK